MRTLSLLDAAKHTSPNPLSLICSRTPDGHTNLATVSWWTYLSLEPQTIGFAMMKTSYTGELVRESRELVLTIPGKPLAKAVMQCGSTTGRTQDKAKAFDIELTELPDCAILIPAHSVLAIHCSLCDHIDVGDHYFYICDVRNAHAVTDEAPLFAWKGYAKNSPGTAGINPHPHTPAPPLRPLIRGTGAGRPAS